MRYKTFTLRIEATDDATLSDIQLEDLGEALEDAEDVINDHLPDGFYCKIDEGSEGIDMAAVRRLEQFGWQAWQT